MSFNIMINSHSQCCGIYLRNIAFSLTFLSKIKPRKLTYKFGTCKEARFPNLTHVQTWTTKQAVVLYHLQSSSRIRNVGYSNPCRDSLKSFKQVVTATLLNARQQDTRDGFSEMTIINEPSKLIDHECIYFSHTSTLN